jgi:starvation-inducible DNA-binding protein
MKYPKTKEILNEAVADLIKLHLVVHQHHWYMRGERFLKLHPYLDEVMDELSEQLDLAAESIVILDGNPCSSLKEVLEKSKIKESEGDYNLTINERFSIIVDDLRQLRDLYQKGIRISAEEGDDSTNDMLILFNTSVEKRIWMMSAELDQAPKNDD